MTPAARYMTAQQLLEYRNEPFRQELIAGILHEMEPTGAEHAVISATVISVLRDHVTARDLGRVFASEAGFKLASDPDTVRAPDAAFVARVRADAIGLPREYWPGPPDLAVEVVSPNDRHGAVEAKALDWLAGGTQVVVVLDPPRRTATVYRTGDNIRIVAGDEPLDLDDVVQGFAPRLADLFA